jgi:hypothetical protein
MTKAHVTINQLLVLEYCHIHLSCHAINPQSEDDRELNKVRMIENLTKQRQKIPCLDSQKFPIR